MVKYILILFLCAFAKAEVDEKCLLPSGGVGLCIPTNECQSLKDPSFIIFREHFCSWGTAKICCPFTFDRTSGFEYNQIDEIVDYSKNPEAHPNYDLFDLKTCGLTSDVDRIAMGEEADLFEFPWNALIGYSTDKGIEFGCGGTLINDRYILTAAHCLLKSISTRKLIRLGEHTKSTRRDCKSDFFSEICADPVQDIYIHYSDTIIHPNYARSQHFNDVGLIRLNTRAKIYQNNIKPVCLPFGIEKLPPKMVVIGFGATDSYKRSSDILMKASIKIIDTETCMRNNGFNLKESQFCAGGKSDSCKGDSGSTVLSPAKIKNYFRFVQFGIVSYGGSSYCMGGTGVYAKVHSYIPWILENVRF